MEVLEAVVAVLAAGLTVAFSWPQVFRAGRHGVDGISRFAVAQSLLSGAAWLGYGIAIRQPALIIPDSGVVLGQSVVMLHLVRNNVLRVPVAALILAGAAALMGSAQLDLLTEPIVTAGGIVGITSVATQFVAVLRQPDRLEGLSAGTYLMLTAMAAAWTAYGIVVADVYITWPNVVVFPMSATVAYRAWRCHRRLEQAARASTELRLAPVGAVVPRTAEPGPQATTG